MKYWALTILLVAIALPLSAQNAPKDKKKKSAKPMQPFKWVNKLPCKCAARQVRHRHLQEPFDGSGGGLLHISAGCSMQENKPLSGFRWSTICMVVGPVARSRA